MKPLLPSLRILPDDWIRPLDFEKHFGRAAPLEVDVGCGKGRFLLARAAAHPETNFLGLDRMLRRIRKVDNKARRLGLANVRLLRMEAFYAVSCLLPPASVSVYYLFFPDPWPKKRHREHRLFNVRFMDALHRTLVPGGALHFATDHAPYFEEVRAILAGDARFGEVPPYEPSEEERTDFERYYVKRATIGRCSVTRK